MKSFDELIEGLINRKLNPALWDDGKLKESVSKALLTIADEFLTTVKIDLKPKDILLTGSCANYNWHKGSDIDLHFLVDFKKMKNMDKDALSDYLYDASVLWNEHVKTIKINGFPVEVYALHDSDEKIPYAAGLYSLKDRKWIKQPILMKDPSEASVEAKAKPWKSRIKKLIEKGKIENDNRRVVDELKKVLSDLKEYRTKGLVSKGEHSMENLVFKNLKKSDLIGELIALSRKVYANSLSLSEERVLLAELSSWE